MHLSPPVALAAVRSKAAVLLLLTCCLLLLPLWESVNCSMFCCTLLYVPSSFAIILMGKRELAALLNLSSLCPLMVERLFLAVPQGCLRIVIMVFPDHTHLLFLNWFNGAPTLPLVCLVCLPGASRLLCGSSSRGAMGLSAVCDRGIS